MATITMPPKEDAMTPLRQKMIEDMQLYGLSARTRQSYVGAVKGLADFYKRSPDELNQEEIRKFFLHLIETRKVAKSTVTVYLSGIKFFCEKTLGHPMPVLDLVRPKRRRKLPCVLTIEEIKSILAQVRFPTIKMLLVMAYSCGLRLSEATHLKAGDVDMARMQVKVTGKGGKDRYVPLAQRCRELLTVYLKKHTPAPWLFTAKLRSGPCPGGTVQKAFRAALRKTDIDKPASVHTLRHSYATHLLENGIDIRLIQAALGHKHPSTTMVYAHLTSKSVAAYSKVVDAIMQTL
jgi:site-specific recombinase XerD